MKANSQRMISDAEECIRVYDIYYMKFVDAGQCIRDEIYSACRGEGCLQKRSKSSCST